MTARGGSVGGSDFIPAVHGHGADPYPSPSPNSSHFQPAAAPRGTATGVDAQSFADPNHRPLGSRDPISRNLRDPGEGAWDGAPGPTQRSSRAPSHTPLNLAPARSLESAGSLAPSRAQSIAPPVRSASSASSLLSPLPKQARVAHTRPFSLQGSRVFKTQEALAMQ